MKRPTTPVVNKPTIVQLAPYYPPHTGGLENVARAISRQLAADGFDVRVITARLPRSAAAKEVKGHLTVRRLRAYYFAHTPFMPGLLRALWATPKHSIFHIHLGVFGLQDMAALVARLRGIPTVMHFHLDVGPSGPLGFILRIYLRTLFKLTIRSGTVVIVFSKSQADLVVNKYGVRRDRIKILPNGVDPAFFTRTDRTVPKHTMRLLYVGRLTVQKRVERLIEALGRCSAPCELRIVGDGEDRAELEALVKLLGLENVSFVGERTGAALRREYARADALVMPSDKEGMSLVMLEAMAAGLPVIGSDVLGIREHLRGVGMLVAAPSPTTFAGAIDAFYADRAVLIPRFAAAGRRQAAHYAWPQVVHHLEKIYEQVAS